MTVKARLLKLERDRHTEEVIFMVPGWLASEPPIPTEAQARAHRAAVLRALANPKAIIIHREGTPASEAEAWHVADLLKHPAGQQRSIRLPSLYGR